MKLNSKQQTLISELLEELRTGCHRLNLSPNLVNFRNSGDNVSIFYPKVMIFPSEFRTKFEAVGLELEFRLWQNLRIINFKVQKYGN